jgi:ech hydrogenase subunit F
MSVISFSKTVLHNLFSKPATRMYPQVPRIYPERTRGQIGIGIDDCIFCGICSKKCPTGAIAVTRETKTWSIKRFGCIQCGSCVEVCPKKCLSMLQNYPTPDALKTVETFSQTIVLSPVESAKPTAPVKADAAASVERMKE